jgi:hypothetical protein
MKIVYILILLLFGGIVGSCLKSGYSKFEPPKIAADNSPNSGLNARIGMVPVEKYEPEENGIVSYGSGVYFFAHTGAAFGRHLAMFKAKYGDRVLETIAPNIDRRAGNHSVPLEMSSSSNGTDYGATTGYWVTFREKS